MSKTAKPTENFSPQETDERLQKTLKAAFNMKPTQLQDIPRKRKPKKK